MRVQNPKPIFRQAPEDHPLSTDGHGPWPGDSTLKFHCGIICFCFKISGGVRNFLLLLFRRCHRASLAIGSRRVGRCVDNHCRIA